jgi:hypothetical protein
VAARPARSNIGRRRQHAHGRDAGRLHCRFRHRHGAHAVVVGAAGDQAGSR